MGSRLLPLSLVVAVLVADGAGLHRAAYYVVLLAVVGAAAAAFVGIADVIEGKPGAWLRGITTSLAVVFLLADAAVRANLAAGSAVPKLALSAAVAALVAYTLPAVLWLLEPLRPRPRARTTRSVRVRTEPLLRS